MDSSTALINGKWSTDNAGTGIYLNGILTSNPGTAYNQFQIGYVPFTINSGFVPGLNTLDFVIYNASGSGGNPTGLRVEMAGSAAVPEPTTIVAGPLLALPLLGQTLRVMRKSKV